MFLVRPDRRILLQRRRDNGLWSNPGGLIEPGESAEQAGAREVLEETGLVVADLALVGVASGPAMHYRYPNGDETHNVTILYRAEVAADAAVRLDEESLELAWFDLDALPPGISPPSRHVIAVYRAVMG